ncbi:sulfite exporter TauE/SafE family protein [Piscinibacter sp. Jin2]|uniref:Sulfite exporter TauE/SafE family protein n=1 Tax=Aquariibacter lacus TaxID=2801332 RepID=A0A9X0XDI5_9BURK|nr:sulfite exporter TauE/SafE family protein [Piscinibacter lacus]
MISPLLLSLVSAAALLGLAGTPHCLAMCAAPCAAAQRAAGGGPAAALGWQLGRGMVYTLAGAVAASGAAPLQALSGAQGVLRPIFLLMHLATLALGLWLLLAGRWPAVLEAGLEALSQGLRRRLQALKPAARVIWLQPAAAGGPAGVSAPACGGAASRLTRGALLGSGWILLPCGLLASALILAVQAPGPAAGAAVMAAFALGSGGGLALLPLLQRSGAGQPRVWAQRLALRLAGAALLASGAWLVWQGGHFPGRDLC